jgi:Ser/Thr protein kinase RdoA (MazF antagonist)
LYELLQTVTPERALTPLGVDVERAWVLLPDGGPTLGERFSGAQLVDALATVLPRYGELQRALAAHTDEVLALGVNDMRAAVMLRRYDEALAAMARYVERHGDAADQATLARVAALRANVSAWCDQLAAAPVSPSLDHNDLHPHNVFLDATAGPRFYDWGDSVVAHPFASMLLALGFMHFVEGADNQAIVRLRDAYLEAFSDLAPHAELVETLELACRVGKIARALTWERALRTMNPDDVDEQWASGPFEAMASLLDDSYLAAV